MCVVVLLLRVLKGRALVFCYVPSSTLVDIISILGEPAASIVRVQEGSPETLYTRLHGVTSQKTYSL